jgi:glycosyltransferase involved in cell wall biosynthesis
MFIGSRMKFSIVIPTYNESEDIAGTINALLNLEYSDYEIIIVDDSTDNTAEIVRGFNSFKINLIKPKVREGRCGARNIGILASSGDILVILNADVRLPKDFLNKILAHYKAGFDYVLVKAQVQNIEDLFARYVDSVAQSVEGMAEPQWMEWTEGFSCLRRCAIQAGLFPTGFPIPICAGEDGFFGANLKKNGAKKKIDFSIVVKHIAPSSLKEYWSIRKGRGKGCPQIRFFLEKWSLLKISAWASLRLLKNLILLVTFLPLIFIIMPALKCSINRYRDFIPFTYAWVIEQVAFHVGEWESITELVKVNKTFKKF